MIEIFFRKLFLWLTRIPWKLNPFMDFLACYYIRKISSHSEVEVSTNYGFKMYVSPSDYVSYGIYYFGDYDPKMSSVVSRILLPGQTAIDVGAERGWFTLLFSEIVGKEGKVLSFEASSNIFRKLKKNIILNNFSWAKCENIAVSDKQGEAYFIFPNDEIIHNVKFLTYNSGVGYITEKDIGMEKTTVRTTTLDYYLSKRKIRRVDLVKMDIEGAEYGALIGARKMLTKMRPKLIVEFNRETASKTKHSIEDINNLLKSLNYSMFTFEVDHFVPLMLRNGKISYPYDVFNVYCFPRGK